MQEMELEQNSYKNLVKDMDSATEAPELYAVYGTYQNLTNKSGGDSTGEPDVFPEWTPGGT